MFVLFAFIFIGVFSPDACTGDSGTLCPEGWVKFDSFCYLASDKAMTWSEAQAYCKECGGELVKITNVRENDFVLALARKVAPSLKLVWIGLKWDSSAKAYFWSDYSDPAYKNWAPNEPNGNAKEPCSNMWTGDTGHLPQRASGYWNDLTCGVHSNWASGLVCKRLP